MHFFIPPFLKAKYAKLRKKKRQLAASKNPDAAEKAEKEAAKKAASTANAKDAKEVAKKLIRTGALPKIQKVYLFSKYRHQQFAKL